jgi:cyanophycin synthetase
MEVARAIAGSHRVRLALGTAGDRTDEILVGLGVVAARADHLVIAEKRHYLRGRTLEVMNERMRSGAQQGGYRGEIAAHPTELDALQGLLAGAKRGDVCAVMTHAERAELFEWLEAQGFTAVGPDRLREVVGR